MHLGLVVYGSLETVSGGYLYDRKLVQHLQSRGDEVEVISVPWRPYGRGLLDNLSPALLSVCAGPPSICCSRTSWCIPRYSASIIGCAAGSPIPWWPSSIICAAVRPGPPGRTACIARWSGNT